MRLKSSVQQAYYPVAVTHSYPGSTRFLILGIQQAHLIFHILPRRQGPSGNCLISVGSKYKTIITVTEGYGTHGLSISSKVRKTIDFKEGPLSLEREKGHIIPVIFVTFKNTKSGKMQDKKIFPLSRLSKAIEQVIQTYCSNLVWVKADIVKLNYYQHSGHAFPELAEKKEGRIVVEMRGTIWKKQFDQINQKFQEVLQEPLKDDMSVVMQVQVNYHAVYSLSVNILDMDPHYTLGELARQKAVTIQRLKQEELFAANKLKTLPLLPKTLAIISVESSKGYQDFLSVIERNQWSYKFHLKVFPAVLQGERAISTIISQLRNIQRHEAVFDA